MVHCAVPGCKNYQGRKYLNNLKFYRFPKNPKMFKKWLVASGIRDKTVKKDLRICSFHFTEDDCRLKDILLNNPVRKRLLKDDAVPTRNLPVLSDTDSAEENPDRDATVEQWRLDIHEESGTEEQHSVDDATIQRWGFVDYEDSATEEQQSVEDGATPRWRLEKLEICEQSPEEINSNLFEKVTVDVATQTEVDPECSRELQIMYLEREVRLLRKHNTTLVRRLEETESMQCSVQKMFTNGQIRRMENPKKNLSWKREDISFALSLYSAGPQAYRLLRNRNFPLPGASTLRRWAAKFKLDPGTLNDEVEGPVVLDSDM